MGNGITCRTITAAMMTTTAAPIIDIILRPASSVQHWQDAALSLMQDETRKKNVNLYANKWVYILNSCVFYTAGQKYLSTSLSFLFLYMRHNCPLSLYINQLTKFN